MCRSSFFSHLFPTPAFQGSICFFLTRPYKLAPSNLFFKVTRTYHRRTDTRPHRRILLEQSDPTTPTPPPTTLHPTTSAAHSAATMPASPTVYHLVASGSSVCALLHPAVSGCQESTRGSLFVGALISNKVDND